MKDYYEYLVPQIRELSGQPKPLITLLANTSAALMQMMPDLNWAGYYLMRDNKLILGPFQGKVACVRIARGKGVCGTAWDTDCVQLVPDVHAFPGHIACDSASRSEIVVPIHSGGEVKAVLDIDSPVTNRFTEDDRDGLVKLAKAMEAVMVW